MGRSERRGEIYLFHTRDNLELMIFTKATQRRDYHGGCFVVTEWESHCWIRGPRSTPFKLWLVPRISKLFSSGYRMNRMNMILLLRRWWFYYFFIFLIVALHWAVAPILFILKERKRRGKMFFSFDPLKGLKSYSKKRRNVGLFYAVGNSLILQQTTLPI